MKRRAHSQNPKNESETPNGGECTPIAQPTATATQKPLIQLDPSAFTSFTGYGPKILPGSAVEVPFLGVCRLCVRATVTRLQSHQAARVC